MSWHYEPIKNKIDWTVSRCVGRFFSPFFLERYCTVCVRVWGYKKHCYCFCRSKSHKNLFLISFEPFCFMFFPFLKQPTAYCWRSIRMGKSNDFLSTKPQQYRKEKKNFFSSVVKTHSSLKKWRNKKRKWAPSQPFGTTTRELTDFFFFLLWALFRTVAQDLRVLRFPFAYRGIKEETDVRTTMENPVQTKIKRKEEKNVSWYDLMDGLLHSGNSG